MVNMASGMYRGRVRPTTKNDVAQHGGHTPANAKFWFTAYIFDIGHPCYSQEGEVNFAWAAMRFRAQ